MVTTGGESLCAVDVRTARQRLLKMHYESGVGHIGGNLSALDAMLVVFHHYLRDEDQFFLSKGHSAGALYTTLWTIGRLDDHDLESFHRDNTLLAGHPPAAGIPDIAFATGSLGHGVSLAAGTALAFRFQRKGARVVCLTSDGEWQEGSTWEGLIFASHHKLNNLTILVDHNGLQGFGSTTEVASMSPLWQRLQGFDVDLYVVDGHDTSAIGCALSSPSERLKVVILRTVKGHGVSFMENEMKWHYLPLTEELYQQAIDELDSR
ncbi:transketolase [Mycobacterium sp. Aquia_216]|uniref:transketolase n=1 Tax=Mycobacterium sp. Aquia_216 TaxID=2991729 RepID=UPI00227ADE34|nr:transketolase [Mycobacterium sp. Aquia_216]WAJ47338.1 transketolase [Mycobacterium sp. Aquia_216]